MIYPETEELLKRVRRIEIKTRVLTRGVMAGGYHSAFKGRGMSFAEVREYQTGDDVRDLDWHVTARLNRPHVKVYEEERELTVMLLVDLSGSMAFGTRARSMRETAAEMAATIAFSAMRNGDKIGVVFFTDRIEGYIPPKKGRSHMLRIIHELLTKQPEGVKTDLNVPLNHLMATERRRLIAFMMSDFVDTPEFARPMAMAARRHDLVAIRLADPLMARLPRVGLVRVSDAETGHEGWLDTGSRRVAKAHTDWYEAHSRKLDETFGAADVDHIAVATDEDYVKPLMRLFARRHHS